MDLTLAIVYFVGFLLFVAAALYAVAVRNLLGVRLQVGRIEPLDCGALPDYLNEFFTAAADSLRELGFQPDFCVRVEDIVFHARSARPAKVFTHSAHKTYAALASTTHQSEMPGVEVTFVTLYTDGTSLLTMNRRRHTVVADIPSAAIEDPFSDSLEDQYQAHRCRTQALEREKTPVAVSENAYLTCHEQTMSEYLTHLHEQGWLKSTGENRYVLRLWAAVRVARQALAGENRRAKVMRERAARQGKGQETSDQVPVEVETDAYRQVEAASERQGVGWLLKTAVFLLSVTLFSIAFGLVFSVEFVLILLLVLLFHEFGHFVGMAIFGYRDLQILFIPFFGAAAVGSETHAKLHQRVIVALLGPLPGIIVGFGLLYIYQVTGLALLFEIALVMLLLNYLNLLPLMPLDGGQVIRMVFMERFPRAEAAFLTFSGVIFVIGALAIPDPVLWILAALTLLSVPFHWSAGSHLGVLLKALKRSPSMSDEAEQLRRLFETLRGRPHRGLSFQDKHRLVRRSLDWLRRGPASRRLVASTLAVYALVMGVPLVVSVAFFASQDTALAITHGLMEPLARAAYREPDWETRLGGARTPEERWAVYQEAGDWHAEVENDQASERYYRLALRQARIFAPEDVPLAQSLEALASVEADVAASRAHFREALMIREQRLGPDHTSLAVVLERLSSTYAPSSEDGDAGATCLERAIAIREQANGPNDPPIALDLGYLADAYVRRGEFERAEQALTRMLGIRMYHAQGRFDGPVFDATLRLAVFRAMRGRHSVAVAQLDDLLAVLSRENSMNGRERIHRARIQLAWMLHAAGRTRDAIGALETAMGEQRAFHAELTGNDSMNPALASLLLGLAYLYDAASEPEQARIHYERAMHVFDENPYISKEAYLHGLREILALPARSFTDDWNRRRLEYQVALLEGTQG